MFHCINHLQTLNHQKPCGPYIKIYKYVCRKTCSNLQYAVVGIIVLRHIRVRPAYQRKTDWCKTHTLSKLFTEQDDKLLVPPWLNYQTTEVQLILDISTYFQHFEGRPQNMRLC